MGAVTEQAVGRATAFDGFVRAVEPRLRAALVAACGPEAGRDATAEALAWAWQHWDRVQSLGNPAGYLYRVGRTRGVTRRRSPVLAREAVYHSPEPADPALAAALAGLTERQRVAVYLVHGLAVATTIRPAPSGPPGSIQLPP